MNNKNNQLTGLGVSLSNQLNQWGQAAQQAQMAAQNQHASQLQGAANSQQSMYGGVAGMAVETWNDRVPTDEHTYVGGWVRDHRLEFCQRCLLP